MIAQGPAAAPISPTSITPNVHWFAGSPKTFQSTSGKGRPVFEEIAATYGPEDRPFASAEQRTLGAVAS